MVIAHSTKLPLPSVALHSLRRSVVTCYDYGNSMDVLQNNHWPSVEHP